MNKITASLTAALVTAAISTTACGNSSNGGGTVHNADTSSPAGIASAVGATGYQALTPPTIFAREEGNATLNGDTLDIVTFSTPADETNWLKAATSFGGIYVHGSNWVVGVGSQASADTVEHAIGGTSAP